MNLFNLNSVKSGRRLSKLAELCEKSMQLELRSAAFESSHFDDACLLQEVQPNGIVLNVFGELDDARELLDDVDRVIALVVDFVRLSTSL